MPPIERVMRALALKKPPPDEKNDDCRTPAEMAKLLLENYRAQLLQRAQPPQSR